MRVQDIIDTKVAGVVKIGDAAPLGEAVASMRQQEIGALVVVGSDGKLKGVISEREIVVALARHGKRALELRVGDVMSLDHPALEPTDSVLRAMTIMTELRVRHLPVMLRGSVVGLISIGDTVKARLDEKISENRILQDIARWPVPRVA
jgi:CBS domain-containing protein